MCARHVSCLFTLVSALVVRVLWLFLGGVRLKQVLDLS